MTIIIGLALVDLGLAVGFIIAWAFGVGASTGLAIGLLLVVAGAIVGFVSEWLIDEAYRKNLELRRQLTERGGAVLALGANFGGQPDDSDSEALTDFLRSAMRSCVNSVTSFRQLMLNWMPCVMNSRLTNRRTRTT